MTAGSFFSGFEISSFINALILGVSIASIWLIAALGLTIIYGTAGVINMAHGEFIMLGAYSSYMLQSYFGLPFLLFGLFFTQALGSLHTLRRHLPLAMRAAGALLVVTGVLLATGELTIITQKLAGYTIDV